MKLKAVIVVMAILLALSILINIGVLSGRNEYDIMDRVSYRQDRTLDRQNYIALNIRTVAENFELNDRMAVEIGNIVLREILTGKADAQLFDNYNISFAKTSDDSCYIVTASPNVAINPAMMMDVEYSVLIDKKTGEILNIF